MAIKKPKILVYDIDEMYRLHVFEDGSTEIYSFQPRSKGKKLSQWYTTDGYLRTKLYSKQRSIHTIVAMAALGPRPEGLVVNHKDGIKTNNHPDNLEYVTQYENVQHSIEHGMHVANDPARSGRYKDGRCADINAYKLAWYHRNKERLYGRKQA